jgi:uncharacterized glyoxalase superfamily protein PhnB
MSKPAQPIPTGCEGPIPHLTCSPCDKALDFYTKAFGAEEICRMPGPDGRLMHAEMKIDGRPIYLADDFPEYCGGKAHNPNALGASPVTIHRYVKDTDAAMKKAETAGGTVVMPATDMFWGDRYGQVKDPFGHSWAFATHIKDMTPEEMMEASKEAFAGASA